MKKRTYLTLLCAVVIVGLLASPVMAAKIAPGELVPFAVFPGSQENPDVDGNMVVWEDGRNGNKDIYFSDTPGYTGDRITSDPASQERPSISGDYIVWQDDRNGDWDIYLYQRSTGEETQLTDDTGDQWLPIVRGNYVAWYDDSSGDTNIVLYDIAAGSVKDVIECDAKTTIPGGSTEFKPALSEKYVAWVEEADERVHYYDIAAGEMKGPVSANTAIQSWPSLYGGIIAWEDNRNASPDIYMTNLDDPFEGEHRITSDGSEQVAPALTGQIVAWEDKRDAPRSIYMYDLSHLPDGEEMAVPTAGGEQLYPAASGNMIVWQKARDTTSDLYAFIYDPEGEPGVVARIEVEPSEATLDISDEMKFNATCYDENDEAMPNLEVSWSCDNGTVGFVDSGGYFIAYEAGTTTVVASAGGITATATVTVIDDEPELTSITVKPTTVTLAVNGTQQFAATAFDQFGEEMTGVAIDWSCSDETVGEIDTDGIFTALTSGTATVTASAGDVTGTAAVTVSTETPVADTIAIEPPTATLKVDATQQFTATVRDQFGGEMAGVAVDWSCSDETVGTIDTDGLFTAKTEGTATVTATAGEASGTAGVTVSTDDPGEQVLTNITVTPSRATLDVDDIQRFIVTAYDQNGNTMSAGEIAWSCSDEGVGTIDANGCFTALAAGTATVTGTAGDFSEAATITISECPALAKIAVVPSAATLEVGDELEFDAVAFDRSGKIVEDARVTWECSDECVGTINECGVFTALAAGTATITACGDCAEGTATVTVNCDDPVLSSIVVTPAAITLAENDTATFTATALDQDGCEMPDIEINWSCSDETVGEIDDTGFFAALAAGTTTVIASADGVNGTADVEVTNESAGVVVSPSAIILDPGDEWQFTATVYDLQDNADAYDLQDNVGSTVTWSCADPEIGEIDADGLFTALASGTTSVTATVDGENETATGTAAVTVSSTAPELTRIEVSPPDFCIPAGNCLALTARGFDQYGLPMDANVTWESSDPCVGTINECGVFTALCDGEVQLIASADGVCGSACVTVLPSLPVPACIEVEPLEATLTAGGTREFTATVFDQCDNEMDWVRVAWSCSNDDVGTIDRAGLFAAFSQGFTHVTACAGGVEETASVTVTAAPTIDPTPGNNGGSTGSASSDGGGDTGPTFFAGACEDLKGGETHTFSGIDITSIGSIAITASDNIPKLLLTVKETGCPNPASPPGGSTYEYVEISLSWANPNQIGGATLTFIVPAKWLEEHGMLPEDVRLMRYVDGGWQILETEVIGEENGNYHFQATTPGFSTFAIAAMPENATMTTETNVTTEATGTPEGAETMTTEPPVAATTTPAAPLVYAPFLAPLAFLLWARKNH
ncbi:MULTISPECIES: Ig-like domain-containing protein [Methanoculleus]|uniref:Ig domain protein, group 2 domain protein n=2 Tax=Methanoculleus TaxID=45989 RepID=A3CUU4_METMJ|nr:MULTISPECIES: Ig-like domain-containing protein [Methanoculleus]ABN57144.1 Ig domain protein, group 2 domain protein [Methanoculleus marisnigri JR1]MCC7555670.1 Ig-like domain-containing protein [Methanoculleus marisnigri]UYU18561.1 Ig-like domain-containing protein [Methanoculleus submarinus]